MGLISFSQLVDNSTAVNAASVNNPLNTIYNEFNGGITDANLSASAAIAPTKIANGYTTNQISIPYKFYVYRAGAWTSGTPALVQFDTKVFDTGSNVDVVTNKGRFTAPVNGFYHFDATSSVNINGGLVINYLYKNGSVALEGTGVFSGSVSTTSAQSVSGTLQLTAGDYVEVYCYGSGAAGNVGQTLTWFQGYLLSAT